MRAAAARGVIRALGMSSGQSKRKSNADITQSGTHTRTLTRVCVATLTLPCPALPFDHVQIFYIFILGKNFTHFVYATAWRASPVQKGVTGAISDNAQGVRGMQGSSG